MQRRPSAGWSTSTMSACDSATATLPATRIIDVAQWAHLEAGLKQRVRVLERLRGLDALGELEVGAVPGEALLLPHGDDDLDRVLLTGQLHQPGQMLVGLVAPHRLQWGRQDAVRVTDRDTDPHRAHIDAEPTTASGVVGPGTVGHAVGIGQS